MLQRVMRSWNLVCAVLRDRMLVSLAHVPQSSVAVPVLPVFSQAKCLMYRYLELMRTVGSWVSRMNIPHSKPMPNFIPMPALCWLTPTMSWNPVFQMQSVYLRKCAKKVFLLPNTVSVSTVVILPTCPKKHIRCLLLPDLMMQLFPLPAIWMNISLRAWRLRMPRLIPGVSEHGWSLPTIILHSAVYTNLLLSKMQTVPNLHLRSSFPKTQKK